MPDAKDIPFFFQARIVLARRSVRRSSPACDSALDSDSWLVAPLVSVIEHCGTSRSLSFIFGATV